MDRRKLYPMRAVWTAPLNGARRINPVKCSIGASNGRRIGRRGNFATSATVPPRY